MSVVASGSDTPDTNSSLFRTAESTFVARHCLSVVLSSRFRVRHWSDTIETPFMITPSRIDGISFIFVYLEWITF